MDMFMAKLIITCPLSFKKRKKSKFWKFYKNLKNCHAMAMPSPLPLPLPLPFVIIFLWFILMIRVRGGGGGGHVFDCQNCRPGRSWKIRRGSKALQLYSGSLPRLTGSPIWRLSMRMCMILPLLFNIGAPKCVTVINLQCLNLQNV